MGSLIQKAAGSALSLACQRVLPTVRLASADTISCICVVLLHAWNISMYHTWHLSTQAARKHNAPRHSVTRSLSRHLFIKIHQRGVQWKQGVVIYMMLCTSLLYNATQIHCTPLPLHPTVLNTQFSYILTVGNAGGIFASVSPGRRNSETSLRLGGKLTPSVTRALYIYI